MSEIVYFSFRTRDQYVESWENVFNVLEAGYRGIKFRKALAVFGNAVVEKLDQIIGENEPECFIFMGWNRENEIITFELDLLLELVDDFTLLFQMCGVEDLSVEVPD